MTEYINTETGEVVSTTDAPRRRMRVASTRQAVGVDTKYPCDCTTEDSLVEALVNIDYYVKHKPKVDHEYIGQCLIEKFYTVQEAALLTYLAKSLVGWNYWMGNRSMFHKIVPQGNLARILKSLEDKGAICITHRDKPFRNDLVIQITPVIAFRGGDWFRQASIAKWLARRQ